VGWADLKPRSESTAAVIAFNIPVQKVD